MFSSNVRWRSTNYRVKLCYNKCIFYGKCIVNIILQIKFQHSLLNKGVVDSSLISVINHCTKKWSFPLRIPSVNMTKSTVSGESGHIYWRNPWWKTSFYVQWILRNRYKAINHFNVFIYIKTSPHIFGRFS